MHQPDFRWIDGPMKIYPLLKVLSKASNKKLFARVHVLQAQQVSVFSALRITFDYYNQIMLVIRGRLLHTSGSCGRSDNIRGDVYIRGRTGASLVSTRNSISCLYVFTQSSSGYRWNNFNNFRDQVRVRNRVRDSVRLRDRAPLIQVLFT